MNDVRLETLRTKEQNLKKIPVHNNSVGKLTLAFVSLEYFNTLGSNRFMQVVGWGEGQHQNPLKHPPPFPPPAHWSFLAPSKLANPMLKKRTIALSPSISD